MASVEVSTTNTNGAGIWTNLARWIQAIPRAALLSMIGPSLLLVMGYFGWRFYGAKHYDATFYGIQQSGIVLSSQPAWVKNSIVEQVYTESGLSRLSLFDNQTPAIIARAFDAHPAVRKTRRVAPLAGGKIEVSVEFRMPVAMVCLHPADPTKDSTPKWLPIDGEGFILPTDGYFTKEDVNNYIWIFANEVRSDVERLSGTPFSDPKVKDAARLCALLDGFRERLQVKSVTVTTAPVVNKTKWNLNVETHGNGPLILWGSAPGWESSHEPSYENKLTRLLDMASDSSKWSQKTIDLTD